MGGVDLSMWGYDIDPADLRPRPCGRGGFKLPYGIQSFIPLGPRPCGRGGFKQPDFYAGRCLSDVPARVGGVDLSSQISTMMSESARPRPCGRGGFKLRRTSALRLRQQSPPVWAGWI